MQNSKLIAVLKTLTQRELAEFRKYISSPYFNQGRDFTPLLKEIIKFYPDFSSAKLTKEYIFGRLYRGKEYKDNVLKTMLSGLNKMAVGFIAQKMFDTNKFEILHARLNTFHNRNLEKQFLSSVRYASEKFGELEIVDPLDALRNKYELSLVEATFYNGRRDLNIKNKKFDVTISVATLFFMEYFVTYADEMAKANAINQPMPEIIGIINNSVDFDKIIPSLAEANPNEKTKISFYYALYKARRFRDAKFFFEARKIFFDNIEFIPKPTKQSFIYLLMNCVVYILRSTKEEGLEKDRYELIKFMFDNELHVFPGDEMLPLGSFKNALNLSIHFNDLAFTEALLDIHVNFLHKNFVVPYKQYGTALLFFRKGNFGQSLNILQKIDLFEPALKIEVKMLLSKLYYELGYWENGFSFIDTFRKFLAENINVSSTLRDESLKYVKHYSELLKLKSRAKIESNLPLIAAIKKDPLIVGQEWLLNKALEIEK